MFAFGDNFVPFLRSRVAFLAFICFLLSFGHLFEAFSFLWPAKISFCLALSVPLVWAARRYFRSCVVNGCAFVFCVLAALGSQLFSRHRKYSSNSFVFSRHVWTRCRHGGAGARSHWLLTGPCKFAFFSGAFRCLRGSSSLRARLAPCALWCFKYMRSEFIFWASWSCLGKYIT